MDREAFEKVFPIPAHWIEWSESKKRYDCHVGLVDRKCSEYNKMFEAWQSRQAEIDEKDKRIEELTHLATELAEYASYAEIIGAISHNREAIRDYCDKIFDFNRKVEYELERALRGERD